MVRDTTPISDDVQIGTSNPDPETTVEALIRAYNRMPLDTGLSANDLLVWDGSDVVGTDSPTVAGTLNVTGTLASTGPINHTGSLAALNNVSLPQAGDTDVKDALVALGLLSDGGASPLDLDGGDLTAAGLNASGDLDHDGSAAGFYGTAPVARPDGVTPAEALEAVGLAVNANGGNYLLSGGTYARSNSGRVFVGSVSPVEAGVTPVDGDIWKVSA